MTDGKQFFTVERMVLQMGLAPTEPTRPIAGEFWHEGELAICVGQAGVGKSALALQLAIGIATGKTTAPGFDVGTPPDKVLLMDHENDDRDQRSRISKHYELSSNIYRGDLSPDVAIDKLDNYLNELELLVLKLGTRYVIIDNIAWLTYGTNDKDIHKESANLMRGLMRLRKKLNLSILVIAHRNKGDREYLDIGSVSGSSNVTRFVPSVFGIAHWPSDENRLYFKQIKFGRGRPAKWTSSSVLIGELVMGNYLQVVTNTNEVVRERELFKDEARENKSDLIREVLMSGSKASDADLAKEYAVSKQLVNKLRKQLS